MKRRYISKAKRQQVYNKFKGHCAYCGCEIEYKDMQIDHIQCVRNNGDNIAEENLMPACRMCNFYKSTMTIEKFREQLEKLQSRLNKDFTYRLAKKYRLIIEYSKPVRFYFEKSEETE